jgi:CRISPR-associated protein Csd1
MILQALCKLCDRESLLGDNPNYQLKRVPWIIRVGEKGDFLGMLDNRRVVTIAPRSNRGRPRIVHYARYRWVPREPERTSGDYAFFLCDTTEYIFGMNAPARRGTGRNPERLEARRKLFRRKVGQCFEATQDEAIGALLRMLDMVADGRSQIQLKEECNASDLITFAYAPDVDRLIGNRPRIREYWTARCYEEIQEYPVIDCLVTGKRSNAARKHPMLKKVPGGTPSGVSLVSFNSKAFESYGLTGNENAPVSFLAAEKCSAALNRLLNPQAPSPVNIEEILPRRSYKISADTVVCFWAVNKEAQEFCDQFAPILEANPDDVKQMYHSIWKGRVPSGLDASEFYALTLSGTQGRAIVRDWFESTVQDVAANIAHYFGDLAIVRNTPKPKERDLPPQLPLTVLLLALAPRGKADQVPPHVAAHMARAALSGKRYPMTVLHRALERMRAEIGRDDWSDYERRDARAALIKAVLIRNFNVEVKREMDPNNKEPGYLLGRLLAIIERTQQIALGDINATVIDRYFSGASATPVSVFPRLLKNMRHHISKVKGGERGGVAFWLDKQADEIMDGIVGFPSFLPLEQQGLFILGYHHQRHDLWKKKDENRTVNPSQEGRF